MVAFNYRGGNKQERNFRIIFSLPEFSSICNTRRYWSLPKYEYCRHQKILGNTGNTSIAYTGRFWNIPVLQILEDQVEFRYSEFLCLHYTKRIEYNSYSYVISAVHNICKRQKPCNVKIFCMVPQSLIYIGKVI